MRGSALRRNNLSPQGVLSQGFSRTPPRNFYVKLAQKSRRIFYTPTNETFSAFLPVFVFADRKPSRVLPLYSFSSSFCLFLCLLSALFPFARIDPELPPFRAVWRRLCAPNIPPAPCCRTPQKGITRHPRHLLNDGRRLRLHIREDLRGSVPSPAIESVGGFTPLELARRERSPHLYSGVHDGCTVVRVASIVPCIVARIVARIVAHIEACITARRSRPLQMRSHAKKCAIAHGQALRSAA